MGRLAGFKYRVIVARLTNFGFAFFRQAKGSHEVWFCRATQRYTTVPQHRGDMPEGTLREVLREAGISPNDFLNAE